jgi:hypothetical protein
LFPSGYSGLHAIRVDQPRGDEPMQVVSGAMGREWAHFIVPPRLGLEAQVAGLLTWFNAASGALDGPLRAGIAHLRGLRGTAG